MTQTVGIIGLGNAGSSLAIALARHFTVVGFDADKNRQKELAEKAMQWASSMEEVSAKADIVLMSLPHPDISRTVIDALVEAACKPSLVIETSTITPKVACELAQVCRNANIGFVDAAIVGGLKAMANGDTSFLVGAEDRDLALARRVLDPIAEQIRHLGPVGAGSGAKIVNNAVMHAEMVVLLEAAAMAEKLGISTENLADILSQPMGLMRPLEHRIGERVLLNDYENGMSVTNARKDSTLALNTAQELGVPLFAILAAHTPYEIAENSGYGQLDYAALAKLWESWCGIEFSKAPLTVD